MEEKTVGISALAEALKLIQITGNQDALNRWIVTPDVNRPGLELAGFIDVAEKKRVTIIGNKELHYLETLESHEIHNRLLGITDEYTPCIIISSNRACPNELLELANQRNFPVFTSAKTSSSLMVDIVGYLEKEFAPTTQTHGSLMSIYGRGVLITGKSGIGKSEISLELLRKGHILVADDAVMISRIQNRLVGKAPAVLYGMLEIRGIGIIDTTYMFGASSCLPEVSIDYMIELIRWDDNTTIDRIPLGDQSYKNHLGVEIPMIQIPVREGRSMSTIIESAVMNYNLKELGFDSNKSFDEKVIHFIKGVK